MNIQELAEKMHKALIVPDGNPELITVERIRELLQSHDDVFSKDIFDNCTVIYREGIDYPIEHVPLVKDQRRMIAAALYKLNQTKKEYGQGAIFET